MAYNNNFGNFGNNNNQRDLLEDFLNDIGPVHSGPSPSSVTSLSSANMGGLNYNRNTPASFPASPSSTAATNPFSPTPTPSYGKPATTPSADPFDDDAFNFRSTPYSPPNPSTNPFYLKTASPAPTSPPQQQPQPLQQAIHIPTSATNGVSSKSNTSNASNTNAKQQQQQSNKYGSSYGSRPGQAPTSVSSASPAQPNFFQQASPPLQQQQPYGMANSQQFNAMPPQAQQAPATFNVAPSQPNFNPYGAPPPQANPYGAPPLPQSAPPQRNPYVNTSFDEPFAPAPVLSPTPVHAPGALPSGVVPSNWTPNGVPPPQQQQYPPQQYPPPPQQYPPLQQSAGGYPQQASPPPPMNNMQASNGFGQPPPPSNTQPKASSSKSGPMGSSFLDSVKGLFTPAPDPAILKKPKGRLQQQVTFAQFQIAVNQIQALFNSWVQNRWFAPVGFMQKIQVGQPQRELVPFWVFSTTTMTTTHGKCCYVSYEKAEGTNKAVENWQDGKATHTGSFKDIILPAYDFTDERKDLLEELKGWDAAQAKQTCNATQIPPNITPHPAVEWTDVWPQYTENVIKKQETAEGKNQLIQQTKCSRVRELKSIVTYTSLSKKLVFFPVYAFSYSYEGKSYKVFVHGQTGQMAGERPYGFGALGESAKSGIESLSDFIHDKMKDIKK
eukprot:TRINITY_DN678_c0_g1_i1.p1 TRINITY_DN678_c0_g1~~TRINITY_DN678_c0_g1_i1.p1  ORF type:complete len:667 (-),score=182.98 TRINITY_DN678_c0_g1_i1:2108-4108(-)